MAGDLTRRLLTFAAGLSLAFAAAAQGMTDPTRPPAELSGAGAASSDSPLQSVLISSRRRSAIINGQVVPLGGMYGEARLVRITPTEVTLKSDTSEEVLKLYPGVRKTVSEKPAQKSAARRAGIH